MKPTKQMCSGCYNDFYNGKGAKECWHFKSATVEKRMMIPIDLAPPYKWKPQRVLSCYRPQRMVNVKPESLTKDGFWA